MGLQKIPSSRLGVNIKFARRPRNLSPLRPKFWKNMKKYEENMKEIIMKEYEGRSPPTRSTERSEVRVVKRGMGLGIIQSLSPILG